MIKKTFTFIGLLVFSLILLSNKSDNTTHKASENNTIVGKRAKGNKNNEINLRNIETLDNLKDTRKGMTGESDKIIKGGSIEMLNGRRPYDLAGREIFTKHFVVRITTPETLFRPHNHEQSELWFILKGNGKVLLDGVEYEVEENDLIILDPWIEHGLSTTSQVTWICLG